MFVQLDRTQRKLTVQRAGDCVCCLLHVTVWCYWPSFIKIWTIVLLCNRSNFGKEPPVQNTGCSYSIVGTKRLAVVLL